MRRGLGVEVKMEISWEGGWGWRSRLAGEGVRTGAGGRGSLGRAGAGGEGPGLSWRSNSARKATEVEVEERYLGTKWGSDYLGRKLEMEQGVRISWGGV